MRNDKQGKMSPPPAKGVRQQWSDMPQNVRDHVEGYLGAKVINTETQSGGFSPGVAARLYTADNRCVFLKAIGTELNPTSVNFHRQEIKINALLPENAFAPKLLWSYDDGDNTGWVALLFENIDGSNPQTPWDAHDLRRVMQAMSQLADQLTLSVTPDAIPGTSDYFATRIKGWQRLKTGDTTHFEKLDAWSKQYIDALCDLEKQAPEAVAGQTLSHFDIRADNIVITPDAVWFVDWPHASIGAAWVDVVLFAPSVAMQGGLAPEALIQLHPAIHEADPQAVTAAIVSMAGMLSYQSLLPAPPGLPTLRDFQSALAETTRQWIAERTGWQSD